MRHRDRSEETAAVFDYGVVARLAGLEPTASASAGLRSIQLSYKRSLADLHGSVRSAPHPLRVRSFAPSNRRLVPRSLSTRTPPG